MTKRNGKAELIDVKELLQRDEDVSGRHCRRWSRRRWRRR